MTSTYNISGSGGAFRGIIRALIALSVALGGIFILATSAIVALFVTGALFAFGALVMGYVWIKSKITGKPMVKTAFDMGQRRGKSARPTSGKDDGVTIDAHKTPEGWSVD